MPDDRQNTSTEPKPAPPLDRRSLNLPNLITLSRLVLSFVLFGMIYHGDWWIAATSVFVVAAATDAIDGHIARKYGLVTTLGRILDPFVDKIIICGAFVFLLEKNMPSTGGLVATADGAAGLSLTSGVTAWMVIAVIGREMFVTGLRSFLEQSGRDFSAAWIGKIKMALQCLAVAVSLLSMSPQIASPGFTQGRDIVLWATVAITLYSGLTYAWRGFRMLGEPQ